MTTSKKKLATFKLVNADILNFLVENENKFFSAAQISTNITGGRSMSTLWLNRFKRDIDEKKPYTKLGFTYKKVKCEATHLPMAVYGFVPREK